MRGRAVPLGRLVAAFAATWGGVSLESAIARAQTGFEEVGRDLVPRDETGVRIDGAMRLRSELLYNLDLDHGLTPSGVPLFPTPLADREGQILTHADMRLRADVALYPPGAGIAVKVRLDAFDNLALGSTPAAIPPVATASQEPPDDALRLERVWGEAATPIGVLAAGRMGNHWGLGMLANGGDCAGCDTGDTADRIAFVTALFDHVWAVAYDFTASGPLAPRPAGTRTLDLTPDDDVRTVTFAALKWRDPRALRRRAGAGLTTIEYGAYVSHRWQDEDVPAWYLPVARPPTFAPADVMSRGYRATAIDGWFRLTLPVLRLEAEAAVLVAQVDQPSLVPGVLLREPFTSRQIGAALEMEAGAFEGPFFVGLDLGYASGDDAPGFGAFPGPTDPAPQPGDLDGPQAAAGLDHGVDNFRFHPDYQVDRILFREIIGTVTDAFYLRPHARYALVRNPAGELWASLAVITSFAVEPESTPGGASSLGVEIDPTLAYQSRDGFLLVLEHAVLFPMAGLDNAVTRRAAEPAQLLRLSVGYLF